MGLTFEDARHFLSRTGFGATPDEIRQLLPLNRGTAVAQALNTLSYKAEVPSPSWAQRLPPLQKERKHWSENERKAFREARKAEGLELKSWWYRVLLTTRNPLLERMILFWHNHFTSSLQKVRWPAFMYQQNVLFRIHVLSSFRTLLSAVAKNPAMLLYLDSQTNHREHPTKILRVNCSNSSHSGKATIRKPTSSRRREPLRDGMSTFAPERSAWIGDGMTTG